MMQGSAMMPGTMLTSAFDDVLAVLVPVGVVSVDAFIADESERVEACVGSANVDAT